MIINTFHKKFFLLLTILSLSFSTFAQDTKAGKDLFRNNCASCHNKDMKKKLTGPALGGAQERWADYPLEDLYAWIRNAPAMIDAGHPKALEVWAEYKPVQMTSFSGLSDEDIANLLAYIDEAYTAAPEVAETGVPGTTGGGNGSNTWLYIILAGVLGIVALIMMRMVGSLNYLLQTKEGAKNIEEPATIWEILTSKRVKQFAIFAIFIFFSATMVNQAVQLGRQIDYAPTQPIKFSHEWHAGTQKIDCKFCHDGARRSKHSVIPSGNTCMNCHKAITTGTDYGTAEIGKIFASVGFNPATGKYIEDYEDMTDEEVEKIFKTWIADEFIGGGGSAAAAEGIAITQWKGIVDALTDEATGDDRIQGPIEWVKVHNLPDHVYFNHSQHVTVGKLECKTCHGAVEEMDVVRQVMPLSMGWCVNCHRQTEVQFQGNDYYKSFTKYHDELKDGTRDKVTVEDVGGLECQKCHY